MNRFHAFLVFFTVILAIFLLFQVYVVRRFAQWNRRAFDEVPRRRWRIAGWVFIAAGNLLVVSSSLLRSFLFPDNPTLQRIVGYSAGLYFASVITAVLILFVRDLIRLPLFWARRGFRLLSQLAKGTTTTVAIARNEQIDERRRQFIRAGGLAAIGATIGAPLLSAFSEVHNYRTIRRTLMFPDLPPGLGGFTVAQVSDIHAGVYMSEGDIAEIVAQTNALGAQMIFVTGDFVDSSDEQIPSLQKTLKNLRAEYGVFGCLGNHDHFATASRVSAAMQNAGIVMLDNAHRTITVNGERLSIVGIDDAGGGFRNYARLDDAVAGLEKDSFKIMLSHHPDFFGEAKKAGMDLTLSGHTHGGQVGVDIGSFHLNPAYLIHNYVKGLFVEEGKQLYVNVGVGVVGAPVRTVPPEITLLTLEKG